MSGMLFGDTMVPHPKKIILLGSTSKNTTHAGLIRNNVESR